MADRSARPEPAYSEMAKALQQHIVDTTKHVSYVLSAADAEALHRAYENGYIADLFRKDGRLGHIRYGENKEKHFNSDRWKSMPGTERWVDGSTRPGSRPAAILDFFKSGMHERFM